MDMLIHRLFVICLLIGSVVASSACSTGPEVDMTIHKSPLGAVYLERISDRSFQAAHPIRIDSNTIALVLRGVLVRSDQGVLQNLLAGKPDALRAFSDDDVAYLAPLISDGLMRAAADQQVGFRIEQIGIPGYSERVGAGVGSSEPPLTLRPRETTTGVIYAYGRSLYLTLTQYRYRQEPATTISMANRRIPDASGLVNHTVSFIPEAAKRPDSYHDARSTDKTLVIDYEFLASLPASSGAPASVQSAPTPTTSSQATPSGKVEPAQKDSDIEALRKELQEIKRQLAEQEAERTRSQPKNSVPQK
ncbi:MAG TPA: hypothetical protein VFJ56_00125 [Nitrospira sp.]|nr:hypothetical protein [Nitrospira sp.]